MTSELPILELLPAVDIVDGQAVQLEQGVAGSGGQYGEPYAAAKRWQDAGSRWLHLVDLDAAFGKGNNADLIADMIARLDLQVELTGGIRDDASLERALATGCRRVNIGTAAIENPEWTAKVIGEHGDRIAIALDVRGTRLAGRAWTSEGGDLWEALAYLDAAGCARYVLTDVNKDGMMAGPNVDMLRQVCERTNAPVIASGGISTLDDLRTLRGLVGAGVEGAIVGSALYKGAFTIEEALDVAGRP
ncbi:MAG: bifunctional 1-(5-phosphoribosyl)-5-((5-phosphoribosylamino)methylideneamino)imidazole-4-carboxamide isomerase/phosphoribosylanthranilate isomerase PriA [Dermatophilus congolensis]|nr:bifunctional 1-(5-phosphoribosyl)-5-((5-phosphoribosylamino)methylideneamino)imidazole-4-carboxamide isomerase/phosphoribosylanthranilate isomerase PriA [Dermatophilus congolensis]